MAVENNSTVRWFHSEMAGAPQINAQAGDLIAILDACLIHGFGTATPDGNKITISNGVATVEFSGGNDFEMHSVIEISGATPAALNDLWRVNGATATTFSFACPGISDGNATGSISVKRATPNYWEKAFGDSLKAAYRSTHPDATGFYLRIDDSAGASRALSPVRGYMSMTDIDTGTNPFPDLTSAADFNWMRSYEVSAIPRRWLVVCDSHYVYLMVEMRANYGYTLYQFGDFVSHALVDDWCCAIAAHKSSFVGIPGAGIEATKLDGSSLGCYVAGDVSGYSGSKAYERRGLAGYPSFSVTGSGYTYPAVSGGYLFNSIVVSDGENVRGLMPGAYQLLHQSPDLGGAFWQIVETNQGKLMALIFFGTNNTTIHYGSLDIGGPWR